MKLRPLLALALGALSCGPVSRRDLSSIPQRQITYDDLCHLQSYFDQRARTHAHPFRAVNEQSTETSAMERDERGRMRHVEIGDGTYLVEDRGDRVRLRQLLHEEYRRLPELRVLRPEADVRLHVGWWQSGTIRRLRPDQEVELVVDGATHELPFNPCVGEFLFGDEAYRMRRDVMSAESDRAHGVLPNAYLHDGGDPDAASPDATATAPSAPPPATPPTTAADAGSPG